MIINKEVLSLIEGAKSKKGDILGYLILLYHGVYTSYIPFSVVNEAANLGVFHFEGGHVVWDIPITEEENKISKSTDKFDWVGTEYVPLFIGKAKFVREATARMKKLFSENPDIRKEEILEAVHLYVNNTNVKYLMFPHYFIEKGQGANKTQSLLHWVDEYRASVSSESDFRDESRRLR